MNRIVPFLLALLFAVPTYAQLEAPKEVEPNSPIVVTCSAAAPKDSEIKVVWRTSSESVKYETVPTQNALYIWAPPGNHWVEATVATQTFREQLVFVPDPAAPTDLTKAKTETVRIAVSFSIERYVANFTVKGTVPSPPVDPTKPVIDPSIKVSAVTYVFEKDKGSVPAPVLIGLDKVNRNSKGKIIATNLDVDGVNGLDQVPTQYKVPFSKAKEIGLPSLIVTAGDTVVNTVKDPKTEESVLSAVPN